MGVDFIRSTTTHEVSFQVDLDKEDLKYGQDGTLNYQLDTDGISLDNGLCFPMEIFVQDNPNRTKFGFRIYGAIDVKINEISSGEGVHRCDGVIISFLNGKHLHLKENDFLIENREDHDSVKCNMNSKIDSHRAENANDDGSWSITAINGMIEIVFTPELLHSLRHKIMYKFSTLLECVNEQEGPEDAEIHCKNEVIKFHKTMLMKISDVFENMLTNPNFKESHNGIVVIENDEISSTSPETIKTFKDILYHKIVDDDDLNVDLILFADRYNIKPIVKICSEVLSQSLEKENVLKIVDAAYKINDDELLKKAMKYVKQNMKKFEKDSDWKEFAQSNPECNSKMFQLMMFES